MRSQTLYFLQRNRTLFAPEDAHRLSYFAFLIFYYPHPYFILLFAKSKVVSIGLIPPVKPLSHVRLTKQPLQTFKTEIGRLFRRHFYLAVLFFSVKRSLINPFRRINISHRKHPNG